MIRRLVLVSAVALAACTAAPSAEETAPAGDTPSAIAPNGVESPAAPPEAADTTWAVRLDGAGPVRVGMTVDEARAALGGDFVVGGQGGGAEPQGCEYAWSAAAPAGLAFMVEGGRVVRVDVGDSSAVATRMGARVGDTEEQVRALYGGRVQIQPHRYVEGGRYLVVLPVEPRDGRLRMVFETDGERVTRYRAGTTPQVEWVEGCA